MSAKKKSVRVHLDLNPKCRDTLERLSDATGATLSDVLRRALAVYDLIIQENEAGAKLIIRKDDTEREIVLM